MIYALIVGVLFIAIAVCIQWLLPDDTSGCHENCDQGRMCTCRKTP